LGVKIKKTEMDRACNTYGVEERCIRGFSGEPEGTRQLGRPRHRWEENVKMDLREVEWGGGGHKLVQSDLG
jgi:hypothetical protein